jgi:hypothetical protein
LIRTASVVSADPATGAAAVRINGRLARAYPGLASAPVAVATDRFNDLVVATTLCQAVNVSRAAVAAHPMARLGWT